MSGQPLHSSVIASPSVASDPQSSAPSSLGTCRPRSLVLGPGRRTRTRRGAAVAGSARPRARHHLSKAPRPHDSHRGRLRRLQSFFLLNYVLSHLSFGRLRRLRANRQMDAVYEGRSLATSPLCLDVRGQVLGTHADSVAHADVREPAAVDQRVDGGGTDAKALGYLPHREQVAIAALEHSEPRRGHSGDKISQIGCERL
jgi:hypothetical protein